MPRVEVIDPRSASNLKAKFCPDRPGVYNFPDDPKYAGWLQGQVARGALAILPEDDGHSAPNPEATGPTAGSEGDGGAPDDGHSRPSPEAEGLTAGSTPGEPDDSHSPPNPEAEGTTPVNANAEDGEADNGPTRAPKRRR